MSWLGYAGLVLMAIALVVALVGLVAALPAALRARRVSRETRLLAEMYRQTIELKMAERDRLDADREALLRPFKAVRRVAGHPLTIALLESYRLRRRRAREAAL